MCACDCVFVYLCVCVCVCVCVCACVPRGRQSEGSAAEGQGCVLHKGKGLQGCRQGAPHHPALHVTHHCPMDSGCRNRKHERRMDRNWRVVMMVAKMSAPKVLTV